MSTPMPPAPPPAPPPPGPPAPAAKGPRNSLGRAALIVAVVAFILGVIPFVGFISWVVALAALVLAIIALTRPRLGKGAAVAGLVVGLVALIVGPAVAISSVVNAVHGSAVAAPNTVPSASIAASAPAVSSPAAAVPSSAAPSSAAPASSAPAVAAAKTYTGSGDDVIHVNTSDPVVVAFSCAACDGNTTLKTDSSDTLPVNTIGAYSGRHLLNVHDGDLLTKLTVGADAHWKLTITPLASAIHTRLDSVGQTVTGKGDDVIEVGSAVGDAKIVNHAGENAGNFVVEAYGDSVTDPLIVNEIGSYSGTDPLQGIAIVQIQSDGSWSLTGQQ